MLKPFKHLLVIAAVPVLAMGALACGGSAATEPTQSATTPAAAAAVTKAPVAANAHGFVKMIGLALGEVALSDTQRASIEKLAQDAEARHASTQQAHVDFAQALAAQVEAGKIDRTALQPKIDAVVAAANAVRPADRQAIETLHGLLDANQRAAFADAMESRAWSHAGKSGHSMMKEWAQDLNLTDDQRSQIKDAMRASFASHAQRKHDESSEPHAHGKQLLEAFRGDRFVMDEVAPAKDATHMVTRMSGHMIGMLETALPILTAEQRTLAAQKIRAHVEALHGTEL
jgi:Spy/CpxP family protein refolding chaperone